MDPSTKPELVVQGVAASDGIAYGQIFLYLQTDVEVPRYQVEPAKRNAEVARFDQALLLTRQQIAGIQAEVEKNLGPDEARIFDAHLMVLEDQALIGETIRDCETTGLNVETCFNAVSQRYIKAFDEIDDEYLKERAGDIRDVAKRVLQNLLGLAGGSLNRLADQRIIVANDISPSESAGLDTSRALAFCTDFGSKTSHAVIVARSMKVPAVVGLRDLTTKVSNEDKLLVDGYDGIIIVNPTEQTLTRYGAIQREKENLESRLLAANQLPAETMDGVKVSLMANIERVDEVLQVKNYLASGVGLYRTEFLYLNSAKVPTEEEQFTAYRTVVEALAPNPVIIRTLDLGGDKPMAGAAELMGPEANPFLGFRAIRFCLQHPGLFKDQLRAILRASACGNVKMMYPMISGSEELTRANALLAEARAELRERGQKYNERMPVGSMIEIPSAAVTIDILAKQCDFFSIGTNDLIQYLLAIDRVNDRVAHLYEPTHPAVLRTLKQIVDGAHARNLHVGVCGEMAGDAVLVPLLPTVKFLVRAMKMADARTLADQAMQLGEAKEIYALAEKFYRERVKVE